MISSVPGCISLPIQLILIPHCRLVEWLICEGFWCSLERTSLDEGCGGIVVKTSRWKWLVFLRCVFPSTADYSVLCCCQFSSRTWQTALLEGRTGKTILDLLQIGPSNHQAFVFLTMKLLKHPVVKKQPIRRKGFVRKHEIINSWNVVHVAPYCGLKQCLQVIDVKC